MGINLAIALTTLGTLGVAWAVAVAEPRNWQVCEVILTGAAAIVIRELRALRPMAPIPSRRQALSDSAPVRSGNLIPFPPARMRDE